MSLDSDDFHRAEFQYWIDHLASPAVIAAHFGVSAVDVRAWMTREHWADRANAEADRLLRQAAPRAVAGLAKMMHGRNDQGDPCDVEPAVRASARDALLSYNLVPAADIDTLPLSTLLFRLHAALRARGFGG